jgi:hypothetical protein
MKRLWSENALSIVLTGHFLAFWVAQAMMGWQVHNQELEQARQHALTWAQYLGSAHFWSATTENWESEFLQMAAFVILTIYLRQRGSAESNPFPDEQSDAQRRREQEDAAQRGFWRRNSLSSVFVILFAVVLTLHFFSSWGAYNLEQQTHGQTPVTVSAFLHTPEFWFESFQNWQSEFLAVVAIVALSIPLRQVGSSQSKAVLDPNEKTGSA